MRSKSSRVTCMVPPWSCPVAFLRDRVCECGSIRPATAQDSHELPEARHGNGRTTPLVPAPLPPEGKQYLRIVWPKAGQSVRFYCYSPYIVGHFMHWSEGRSELCLLDTGDCAWCTHNVKKLWYGYAYGHSLEFNC